jgi:hypothetical protein
VVTYTTTTAGACGAQTWTIWVVGDSGTSATTNTITTTSNHIWTAWNSASTASTMTITSNGTDATTWTVWNEVVSAPARRISAEERRRWRAREQEQRRRHEEEQRERKEAEAKAETLLLKALTPEQREDYRRRKCFHLHTGGKRYRIERGWQGNVKLVDDAERQLASYCIHPRDHRIPVADNLLAQKLLLEADEQEFRRIANETRRAAVG